MKNEKYYASLRVDLLSLLPDGARTVLDVGCGSGATSRRLLEIGVSEVVGIEVNADMASRASMHCRRVLVGDIETMDLDLPDGYFDVILMADVLEHLLEPYQATTRLLPLLKTKGSLLISIPNVPPWQDE